MDPKQFEAQQNLTLVHIEIWTSQIPVIDQAF